MSPDKAITEKDTRFCCTSKMAYTRNTTNKFCLAKFWAQFSI